MHDNLDAAPGRRALLKNALVLAGALAVPGAVSARGRLTAGDLRPVRQPPIPSRPTVPAVPQAILASSRVVRPALLRQA
ncbi:transcriptional initiation protein Tat, partial [Stenotrophomonas sp. HMWF022]